MEYHSTLELPQGHRVPNLVLKAKARDDGGDGAVLDDPDRGGGANGIPAASEERTANQTDSGVSSTTNARIATDKGQHKTIGEIS